MDSVLGDFLLRSNDNHGDLDESLSHSLSAPRTIHEPTPLVCTSDVIVVHLRVHALFRPRCSSLYVPVHALAFHYLAHRSAGRCKGKPYETRRSALKIKKNTIVFHCYRPRICPPTSQCPVECDPVSHNGQINQGQTVFRLKPSDLCVEHI